MNESLLALLVIMFLLIGVVIFIAEKSKPRLNKQHFQKHWQDIEASSDYSRAVLRADSLLDEAMRHAKIKGVTMGERLNNSGGLIKDINAAWSAHKLRNTIAHEVSFEPTAIQCQRALRQFKRALKDLGAL